MEKLYVLRAWADLIEMRTQRNAHETLSSPMASASELRQLADVVDALESWEEEFVEKIVLVVEVPMDEVLMVEAVALMMYQCLEAPCRNRNFLASAFPWMADLS